MAQITSVTSESLQAKIRELLPSQQGFGEDLQATNVITPIIDLTTAAEGSAAPEYQAQAIAFGSQTAFDVNNTTTVLANTPGFWRIWGTLSLEALATVTQNPHFSMTDGLSVKKVWGVEWADRQVEFYIDSKQYDFVVFLRSGDSISAVSDSVNNSFIGSYRQVADVNGKIVYPVGFTPQ